MKLAVLRESVAVREGLWISEEFNYTASNIVLTRADMWRNLYEFAAA